MAILFSLETFSKKKFYLTALVLYKKSVSKKYYFKSLNNQTF